MSTTLSENVGAYCVHGHTPISHTSEHASNVPLSTVCWAKSYGEVRNPVKSSRAILDSALSTVSATPTQQPDL